MKEALEFPSPRAWMQWYYRKNPDYFGAQPGSVEWGRPGLLVASAALRLIKDPVICFAVDDVGAAERLLDRAGGSLLQGIDALGQRTERDGIDLDRPALSLASLLGNVLAPQSVAYRWPVPWEAFPSYISGSKKADQRSTTRVLWALFAMVADRREEYERALRAKTPTHRDLQREEALLPQLWRLRESGDDDGWGAFEHVLARWLNPLFTTESAVSVFRDHGAGLLTLAWCLYRLRKQDRTVLLRTYFGETLSTPVLVKRGDEH